MPVDVKLWSPSFYEKDIPSWPCPTCDQGRLIASEKGVKTMEPAYSTEARARDAWEPDWIVERFIAILTCSNTRCGEVVMVGGDTETVEDYDEDHGRSFATQLRPRAVFPAPPITIVPKETPREVRSQIELAFQLYWSDLNASASRLRTSVERLLDDFKIPKTRINKKKKRAFIWLAERIDLFAAKHAAHAQSLHALREVGNVGTHSSLNRQTLLGVFSIYEEALAEIYGKRSKKTATLVKKIRKGKGKLSGN